MNILRSDANMPMDISLYFLIKFFYRISLTLFVSILLFFAPNFAVSDPVKIEIWNNVESKNTFLFDKYKNNFPNNSLGLNISQNNSTYSYNFSLNYIDDNTLTFDQSNIEYKYQNLLFGIGKINRNWSFSPTTSLIVSTNARPANSIYFKVNDYLSSDNFIRSIVGPWSLEVFNSILSNSTGPKNAMLLGMRAVMEPATNVRLELLKTAQWGGADYNTDLGQIKSAIIGNTNEYEYAHINQLGGFGLSYDTAFKNVPTRFYGQFIGEDEAGGLPSCFMKLLGTEMAFNQIALPTKINVEYVDTRIDRSTNGNCGPNFAYNNNTYDYTNYDTSIGAPIDTEGKSIKISGSTSLNENLSLSYSTKKILVNDTEWDYHRLSTTKQAGWLSSLAFDFNLNSLEIHSSLNYQGFTLNKINSSKGVSVNLSTKYKF